MDGGGGLDASAKADAAGSSGHAGGSSNAGGSTLADGAAGGAGANSDAAAGGSVDNVDASVDASLDVAVANADGSDSRAADGASTDVAVAVDGSANDSASSSDARDASDGSTTTSDGAVSDAGTRNDAADSEAGDASASTTPDTYDPACSPQPPEAGTNLVTNADLESGTTGWAAKFGGTLSASSTNFHCGTHSAASLNRTAFYNVIAYTLALPVSTTYQFSFWVKQTGTATLTMGLQQYLASGSSQFGPATFKPVPPNTWTRISGTLSTPATAPVESLMVVTQNESGSFADYYVDDLYIIQ